MGRCPNDLLEMRPDPEKRKEPRTRLRAGMLQELIRECQKVQTKETTYAYG